jgi:sugar O-acyltransferase (sialic acid O-acetyltransferase NeuD family)
MSRVVLVGLSHETLVLARSLGHDVVGAVDPAWSGGAWQALPVHRTDDVALEAGGFDAVVLAIDAPKGRQRAFERYAAAGATFADLIGGRLGEAATHGPAALIQIGAQLSEDSRAGRGLRLNTGANVMHDVTIGDFVSVAPNAVVLSKVRIGSLAYIGANATILPGLAIGSGAVVGAGAVVTRDVEDGATVKGNPAR